MHSGSMPAVATCRHTIRTLRTFTLLTILLIGAETTGAGSPAPAAAQASEIDMPIDQLVDLTGRASAVVTLRSRDSFANEFLYDVRVKNQSVDPLLADSLIVVLDQITDLAGKDANGRIEAVGQDGEMADGRPYFRIPRAKSREPAPYSESESVPVRLRNPAYTVVFTPSFRVFGLLKKPPSDPIMDLIRLLIKKGVITEEEWEETMGGKPHR